MDQSKSMLSNSCRNHKGPYSPTILQNILSLVLKIFLYLAAFECNATKFEYGWDISDREDKYVEQEGHDGPISLHWLICKIPSYQTLKYTGFGLRHKTPKKD